jgi:DNA invertase Pin-like site-specific DNA recombinase
MKVALYARVSTERQAERGTIGSQLQVLREHVTAGGDELAGEYVDDGQSGARLDRPGLDALRDAAEAGLFELVWCLSPDRLARAYAYQVLVLDELARFGVTVRFTDAPDLAAGDPQATLLTQVQGVIAEYEKAKIAERYRRGKLFRARAGEITTWKTAYGYRRVARTGVVAAHLEIYEPEAAVVRRIFTDRAAGITVREICRRLNTDRLPSPTGKATWGHSTLCRLLRNEAYIGRVYFNRTETIADPRPARRTRQVPRPREEWIPIDCPRIITDEQFEAATRVAYDNTKWSPRRAEPGAWLLKGLVKCGVCDVGTNCHKMRGRNGTWHRYYYCRNHDPLRAGGEERRCPERNIRADALDEYVFGQIRTALIQPKMLLAGEQAIAVSTPIPDDELLAAELARLDRKIDATTAERRRLADLYQAGLIDLPELQRRSTEVTARQRDLQTKRDTLAAERTALTHGNLLRRRVTDFARQIREVIDQLDRPQRQQLLRLLIEDVHVTGWQVKIRLRIPLDPPDPGQTRPGPRRPAPSPTRPPAVSSQDRLRSVGGDHLGVVDEPVDHRGGDDLVAEYLSPPAERLIAGHDQGGPFIPGRDQLEEQVRGLGLERDVAHLVDDQDGVAAQPGELGLQPSGVVGVGEPGDPLRGGGEGDPVPGLAGADRQPGGQVRLSGAGRAQKHHVVAGGDEVQGAQVRDDLPLEAAGVAVVEVLQRLAGGEPGGPDPALPAVALAGRDLPLQARDQEFLMAPRLSPCPVGQPGHRLAQRRGFQRPGQERDLRGQVTARGLGGGHHATVPPAPLVPSAVS